MEGKQLTTTGPVPDRGTPQTGQPAVDPTQKVLALGLEVSKRIAELSTLEEIYFFLVNDLRVLVEFDRCFLVTHMGGVSRFTAAGNQPELDTRSKLYDAINGVAPNLKQLQKALLLSGQIDENDTNFQSLDPELKSALKSYLAFSQPSYFFAVPLIHDKMVVAHLLLEFMDKSAPNQLQIIALLHTAPLFAAVLTEKWLLEKKPGLVSLVDPALGSRSRFARFVKGYGPALIVIALLLTGLLFFYPMTYKVGGEAQIAPWDKHVAFCKMDGLVEKVLVSEGDEVKAGQTLAELDPKELEFKIESSVRESELLARQVAVASLESDRDPSKLAEARILELKKQKIENDLKFLKWQKQFLAIKSPVRGILLTKDIESLAGKKFVAGEPFCEIAIPGELAVNVLVPEDKVSLVKEGDRVSVYLNNDPLKRYELTAEEVSPAAEAVPRLGNVCRVRARFPNAPPSTKVGMKGVAKIPVKETNLWFILRQRLALRFNQLMLYF